MLLFGFFLFPISEHSFTLQALRLLYKARTKDDSIFKHDEKTIKKKDTFISSKNLKAQ